MFSQRADSSGSAEVRKFLIKWQGLSYSEATWETEADVLSTGDQGRVSGSGRNQGRLVDLHCANGPIAI